MSREKKECHTYDIVTSCYVITKKSVFIATKICDVMLLTFLQTNMSFRGNRGYPHPQQGNIYGHETLEEENEQLEGELKGKISALKHISIGIRDETREQNKLLRSMDDQFDSTDSMFGNTIGKVLKLAKSNHKYYIYYLLLFCLFVFLVLWFTIR